MEAINNLTVIRGGLSKPPSPSLSMFQPVTPGVAMETLTLTPEFGIPDISPRSLVALVADLGFEFSPIRQLHEHSVLPTLSATASSSTATGIEPASTPISVADRKSTKGRLNRCVCCLSAFKGAPTSVYSINVQVYNAQEVRYHVKNCPKVFSQCKKMECEYYCFKQETTACACK